MVLNKQAASFIPWEALYDSFFGTTWDCARETSLLKGPSGVLICELGIKSRPMLARRNGCGRIFDTALFWEAASFWTA